MAHQPQTPNTSTPTTRKRRRQGVRLTPEQRRAAQDVFLHEFAIRANLTSACRAAGIDRSTAYDWQERDEAFSFRYKQAEAEANDVLRAAIFQRAVQGVEKPLHYQGRVVQRKVIDPETGKDRYVDVTVREYSDTLLIFLAKARMPSEFRERASLDLTSGGHSLMEDLALTLARLRDTTAAADDGMPAITDGNDDGNRDPTQ